MRRLLFTLSMPSHPGWGDRQPYVKAVPVRDAVAEVLRDRTWFHRWDDGWTAKVVSRVMERGERTPDPRFAGYDWMVDSILKYSEIRIEKKVP